MAVLAPVFGIFTSFILLYYLSALNRSNIFLALFILCCNLIVLVYFGLHFTKILFWEGVCFVHFLPLSYLIGPALFFYVKHTVSENKSLRRLDLAHLLPAIFVGLATLPFTTLPFATKTAMAHQIVYVTFDYNLNFNWVSFEQILLGRSIHLFIYCCLSIGYFIQNKKHLLKKYKHLSSNHQLIQRWIYSLITLQIVIAINSFGHMLTIYAHDYEILGIPSSIIFSEDRYFTICGAGFFTQNFILFLFPKILNGNISYQTQVATETLIQELKSNLPKKSKVYAQDEQFQSDLSTYLEKHPYLQQDFSISQMSFDLKIPERFLSQYFNKDLNKTFGEWKNDLRIEYACQLILEGRAEKNTIEAISSESGFVSRSKFIDAFKSRMEITPSNFIKKHQNRPA